MKILYATDGSDGALTAARLLASLPLPADARVTVLSVMRDESWRESMIFIDTPSPELEVAREHAQEAVALLARSGLPVVHTHWGGNAATAILDDAEADHADLIVVGCHDKRVIERFLAGSVSERVARYAHASVLVARRDRVERVIAGVDGSESAEHALDALAHLPLPAETRFTVVYVVPGNEEAPLFRTSRLDSEERAEEYEAAGRALAERIVGHAQQRLRAAGRAAEVRIRRGAPAEQLIAAAREEEADLVVVGSANRSTLGRLFLGSVSSRVLSHAPCSVLVARSAPVPASAEVPASEVVGARR